MLAPPAVTTTATQPDTLSISGTTTWTAGIMSGSGSTHANGGLALSSTSPHDLDGRTLRLQSASSWTGTGALRLGLGALVDNQGTWDVQTDSSFASLAGGGTVTNGGTLRKSAGAGTHAVGLPFTSTGTVEAQSGTLSFTAGYTQTAGSTIASGGTLSSTIPFQIQGGTVGGTGTLIGGVSNTAGTAAPGLSPGIVTVSGGYQQAAPASLSAPPLPAARSASHHAALAPSPCSFLSQSRRACSVRGPSLLMSASHCASDLPVFSGNSAIHFCTIKTPGCTL